MSSVLDFELKHPNNPGRAVLLFHGMTGSPFEMKKYAKHLFQNGYDVYGYCLPGHGDHPQDIYSVSWQDWISFSEEKYTALRSKYDDFFLGGLCLGAVIALNLAQNHKDITGLIGLSTTLYLDGWTIPWYYNSMIGIALHTILRYYYTFPEREPYGIKNEIIRRKMSSLMKKNTVAMDNYPMSCIYELLKLSEVTRKNIDKVDLPVLLIHSVEDDLTSDKSAKFVYDNISSVQKEMILLDNSYHLVIYDNEKELVFNKSVEFLNSLSKEEQLQEVSG
ncbi:MAG: alpha/beta fold hydrolase [Candidatus Gastranaerophilales bacterium]|nr:alpha/beta fold hydrolase [Candidatus Gastranaerophilales bacterium]